MAGLGSPGFRPWVRDLVLGSETVSSPLAGRMLEVLPEPREPGPSGAADAGTWLLLSDGAHSIRCLLTCEALDACWEEKELDFLWTKGQILLLWECKVRILVAENALPQSAEFYLQVDSFSLLPREQHWERVKDCNRDPDVRRKLRDCLDDYLSEFTSPNSSDGTSLSQLLDEVQEEHQGALEHLAQLAEDCLKLTGSHCRAPRPTRWATLQKQTTVSPGSHLGNVRMRTWGKDWVECYCPQDEDVYTVPGIFLHIPEEDQRVLSFLGSGQGAPGASASSDHVLSQKDSASLSLLSATSSVPPDPVHKSSSQPQPAVSSGPFALVPKPPQRSHTPVSPLLSSTPVLSSLDCGSSLNRTRVTTAQKTNLELGLLPKSWKLSSGTSTTKGSVMSNLVWDPPKRHRDGSAFQYEYQSPCASLRAQVQGARLPPQLVSWALLSMMEPLPEPELTQV